MKAKSMWASSTVWLNLVGGAAIVLELINAVNLPLSPEWQALLLAVLNLANRFRTKQPVRV